MTPAARTAAAIEVLTDVEDKRRPASDALKDWGLAHRFAGSKDRSAIAALVYDALRRKASSAWLMDDPSPRASVIGALKQARGMSADDIEAQFTGEGHSPAPLTERERDRLSHGALDAAPAHIRGDYPEWLSAAFAESFGERAAAEGEALARRAPVDLRVNTLKSDRAKALVLLAHLGPRETPFSPIGLRIEIGPDGRGPALAAEPAYAKGLVEIQDEGSQIAALLCNPAADAQALDLCAGAGGKTLALAAMMGNRGQIYATDPDGRRLMPIFERLKRAGARNVQVRPPQGAKDVLADLVGRCDVVLVDAPCSGSGAWRRNPDAKWRIRPGALEQRVNDQRQALARASQYVKNGGRLVYVTCSLFKAENEDRVSEFLAGRPDFLPVEAAHLARSAGLPSLVSQASALGAGLRLSPLQTFTDGFYIAALARLSGG
ncbi:MAG TPA: RsmB/NOP family class I SAM-dependent RNA methyltransferase [Roseiarcus sp.]|nr:RsmB/NOP family class I SAM-dependent RNA methyltransferase [Roseiarcus sp.]